eukprot:CAMPEP_0114599660 /NCGR_PEP_ID=MMETSP0125-20121206/22187_1 /TAXON_ID=485358 ORGANISM="Aristerostoma sp., Strain ATCC 50986" /NCGR_SAMPLE_ID=MMETSP0125 /ASSEMBLY_ACC=CAM_ASM_000245 /LENGTH=261 /DNA_ID=CAMNT_0001806927 /DNA_START=97 /DNA_END=883 /DNA_ORIENTATION=+
MKNLFQTWKLQHSKQYQSLEEEAHRFGIFQENVAFINAHNADESKTFTLAVNKFADLTSEEFGAIYNGYKHDETREKNIEDTVGVPSEVDWTKKGAVTGVKNQVNVVHAGLSPLLVLLKVFMLSRLDAWSHSQSSNLWIAHGPMEIRDAMVVLWMTHSDMLLPRVSKLKEIILTKQRAHSPAIMKPAKLCSRLVVIEMSPLEVLNNLKPLSLNSQFLLLFKPMKSHGNSTREELLLVIVVNSLIMVFWSLVMLVDLNLTGR